MKRQARFLELLESINTGVWRMAEMPRTSTTTALTIRDAAERAGVSQTTIRRAIHTPEDKDRLAASNVALGKSKPSYRIRPADLEAWLTRQAGGSQPPPARPATRVAPASRHFK